MTYRYSLAHPIKTSNIYDKILPKQKNSANNKATKIEFEYRSKLNSKCN